MAQLLRVRGIERTTPGFRAELIRLANRLGLSADAIAGVIALESGFNAQAVNPNGGATGLIQFMPNTARKLGTTTEELLNMNATEQLKWVELYLKGVPKLKPGSGIGDYYMAVFMPGFIGLPKATPIAFQGDQIYNANKVLDRNKDGVLTVGDVHTVIESELARAKGVPPLEVDPLYRATPDEWAAELREAARFSSPQARRPLGFGGHVASEVVSVEQLYERVAGLGAEHEAFRTHLERLERVAGELSKVAETFTSRDRWEQEQERRLDALESEVFADAG